MPCSVRPEAPACVARRKPPRDAAIISKASSVEKDGHSGFEGTDLADRLRTAGIEHLLVGGLATSSCMPNSVIDAMQKGFDILFLLDATGAVEVRPGDRETAISEIRRQGAHLLVMSNIGQARLTLFF